MAVADGVTWDLKTYFPEFGGTEYKKHRDELIADLDALAEKSARQGTLTGSTAGEWAALWAEAEKLTERYSHISSYIGCLVSADAKNADYRKEQAALAGISARFEKAMVPFRAALKDAEDSAVDAMIAQLGGAEFAIRQERLEARHTMPEELEKLAADLNVDGLKAFSRLWNNIAGGLEFDLKKPDGSVERVGFAMKNTLLDDPDPEIRRAALEGSNAAWEVHTESAAACLNAIAGTRHTLNKRRGIENFLDVPMFQSCVTEKTVETMFEVVAAHRDVARGYLKKKAELLGMERLGFQDLSAPMPFGKQERVSWPEGVERLLDAFKPSYPAFAEFAREMIDSRRVESERRPGKRPGAFCTTSYLSGESRVFMTWGGTSDDLRTLAHELGHAWHNRVLADKRTYERMYPMTLAETASTFAEEILVKSLLAREDVTEDERARILAASLDTSSQYLLNIHMRYIFEKSLYRERRDGELSVERLKELMLEAQQETYGDALRTDERDPLFWATKLHFYIAGVQFYNFPYTFGFLFSRGLNARFREEGLAFLPKYEKLLRLTGGNTCEDTAQKALGVDLQKPDYWEASVKLVADDLSAFEGALGSKSK